MQHRRFIFALLDAYIFRVNFWPVIKPLQQRERIQFDAFKTEVIYLYGINLVPLSFFEIASHQFIENQYSDDTCNFIKQTEKLK